MKKYKLSTEEQEILNQFDKKSLIKSNDINNEISDAVIAAANFQKKSDRINIRLKHQDLNQIKRIAAQEGLPYQSLIASVLHKYAQGYLKVKAS